MASTTLQIWYQDAAKYKKDCLEDKTSIGDTTLHVLYQDAKKYKEDCLEDKNTYREEDNQTSVQVSGQIQMSDLYLFEYNIFVVCYFLQKIPSKTKVKNTWQTWDGVGQILNIATF